MDLVQNVYRFFLHNAPLIQMAPLQTYVSALLFCPKQSLTRKLFVNEEPTWILRKPIVDETWSPLIQTLEDVSGFKAVTFSHDSKILASISVDGTISVWDAPTGLLKSTLGVASETNHGRSSLVFSYNSRLLASAHGEAKEVAIWDVATGNLKHIIQCGVNIKELAFTHDSKNLLATTSRNPLTWETETWSLTNSFQNFYQELPSPYFNAPSFMSFSPDSQFLALGEESAIYIWDISADCLADIILYNVGVFSSIDFSHDSGMLACGTSGGAVLIHGLASWSNIETLKSHHKEVNSLKFSQDSKLLVSAAKYKSIKIWSTLDWSLIKTLDGSASIQFSLSHDNSLLASASDLLGGHVRIWDMVMLLNEGNKSHDQTSQDSSFRVNWELDNDPFFSTDLERVAQ